MLFQVDYYFAKYPAHHLLIQTGTAREYTFNLLVGIDRAQETSAAGGADGREWEDRRPAPGEDPVADGPGDVLDFLIVALRVEMAAVYLRLVGNALQ